MSWIRIVLPLLVTALFLALTNGQSASSTNSTTNNVLPQENFTISVTANFHPNASGLPYCTACDCKHFTCGWFYNFTCASRASEGADDAEQRWGNCTSPPCTCFTQSGVGFQGVTNVQVTSNPTNNTPTRIGKISHYNNAISGSGIYAGSSPTRLRLTLYVSAPEFTEDFIIGYPLNFDETTNTNPDVTQCDPGIQRTNTPCDDIFVFSPLVLTDSFTVNDRQYTLEIVGFLQPQYGLTSPIRQFVTQEGYVTTADVYARIISFCSQIDCGPRGQPRGAPQCGCECSLATSDCQNLFGESYFVTDDCQCVCLANETVCSGNLTVNPDNCGCGCSLNDTYCYNLHPLFQLTPDPNACECVCNKQTVISCNEIGGFWIPEGSNCDCVCNVSTEACVAQYGAGYTADFTDCVCQGPGGGGGISAGAIAGAVIGSVVGAALLTLLVLGLAALLVYLIRSGHIPGIYGYKLEAANMTTAQNSSLFQDKWSVAGNQLG